MTVNIKNKRNNKFVEDIVKEVRDDFEQRAYRRRPFEAQWQLNTNFVIGNQYCSVNAVGDVEEVSRDYFWQEREVFNHIASIAETRMAKLSKVRPKMSVRPASGDDDDIMTAKVATKILASASNKLDMSSILSDGTKWSELTGTVFYKVVWDSSSGTAVGCHAGKRVCEGDVRIDVCPPYEIYPYNIACESVAAQPSIIHAKAVHIKEIKSVWGVDVEPENVELATFSMGGNVGGLNVNSAVAGVSRHTGKDYAVVIERYTRPNADLPEGELVIIAGDKLLYYGELPYINGADGTRELPFVKQDALKRAGCFFGTSMVERAIPIQRAYNAVKNRKHEFLNRIAMGVLAVEDGSIDLENLENEGISPGKILVYRQGSTPPVMMNMGSVPNEFSYEEDRLLSEFISVSGVSEIMRSSSIPSSITSGTALQLLLDQDDTRLSVTAENIRAAARIMAQMTLRLYKQFASQTRLGRFVGDEGEVELISWNGSDIGCDDVVFDSENEMNTSQAARQAMIFDLLKAGLLNDENGKLNDAMRYKILDVLGYGSWEMTKDVERLHVAKADKENFSLIDTDPVVSEIDDHQLHIRSHKKFMLGSDFAALKEKRPDAEKALMEHIRQHKKFDLAEKEITNENG